MRRDHRDEVRREKRETKQIGPHYESTHRDALFLSDVPARTLARMLARPAHDRN